LNAPSDGSDVITGGSAFQTFAAATGKARSPMVLCNNRGTCSDGDDADHTDEYGCRYPALERLCEASGNVRRRLTLGCSELSFAIQMYRGTSKSEFTRPRPRPRPELPRSRPSLWLTKTKQKENQI